MQRKESENLRIIMYWSVSCKSPKIWSQSWTETPPASSQPSKEPFIVRTTSRKAAAFLKFQMNLNPDLCIWREGSVINLLFFPVINVLLLSLVLLGNCVLEQHHAAKQKTCFKEMPHFIIQRKHVCGEGVWMALAHVQQLCWTLRLQIVICLLLFVSLQLKTHVRVQKFHRLIWLKPLRRVASTLVRHFVTRVKQDTWGRRVPPVASNAFKMAAWSNGQSAISSVNVRFPYWFDCIIDALTYGHLGLDCVVVVVNQALNVSFHT